MAATLADCIYVQAVADALAGTVYGAGAIPAAWLSALRGREVIEACLF